MSSRKALSTLHAAAAIMTSGLPEMRPGGSRRFNNYKSISRAERSKRKKAKRLAKSNRKRNRNV